ncbi:SusC/RagA family TonB-linked outer membrane protein [Carboxylicivirga mesophila]|uniref:SusC/RagA family TonB-linked outer membrane protein n=1 Tax=Carboxylicivirga mesophila TaxID=1166478 RepID=A0ABS5K621_9BACT|nr:SusC/RagA family TonB-linked outer membrane protein [Carboxylicivirga mesophila]MBS2210444.1 SusC/RagA family TonB-linked outer membrane protein [Carboxylicivirga mesophila]
MKKNRELLYPDGRGTPQIWRIMKLSLLMMFVILWHASANSYSQETKLKLDISNASVKEVFKAIKSQSRFTFIFNEEDIAQVKAVSLSVNGETVESVLSACLQGTGLTWQVIDDVVIIKPSKSVAQQNDLVIKGQVLDEKGQPVPGVNIIVLEYNNGTISDSEGRYELTVPDENAHLVFTFIGFEKQTIAIDGRSQINVTLITEVSELGDVVVTGYYNQTKESFTGAATTISSDKLQEVSNTNVLQALQVFDPSFKIVDNNDFGSNPNRMPEIEVRGKASFPGLSESEIRSNPNQPTFILDGFEVNLEKIYDLDINRIASVTILKDASATAIYGSRAANGVVVIETKAPEKGKLRVNYTFDGTVSAPDLSDYNLLNATNKLEAERLAGLYTSSRPAGDSYTEQVRLDQLYNQNLQAIKQGVNTDWIAQPVENSFSHKHSLFLEGGDDVIRYALEGNFNDERGVMKGSGRKRYALGSMLSYRFKNITFKNHLTVTRVDAPDSPYGSFADYARLNPYYRMKDENGRFYQTLRTNEDPLSPVQYSGLYDAHYLANENGSKYTNVTNNFSIDWMLLEGLRLKGNMSFQLQNDKSETFSSPESIAFINTPEEDFNLRGSYYVGDQEMFLLDGNLVLSYFKQIDKHFINAVIGGNIQEQTIDFEDYTAEGFANDRLSHVSFGAQFKEGTTPGGYEETSRLAGAFSNLNYNFDNRFLADASLRIDGSSKFGKNQRTAPFWSAGLGWNIHNESFFRDNAKVNELRLRANVGETGGDNFYAYQALTTYQYITDRHYRFNNGAFIKAIGNEDLRWQTTMKRNVGLDLALFNSRLMLSGNYYYDTTKDLLTQVTIAPSIGFSSFTSNMGDVLNKGVELNVSGTVYKNSQKGIFVNLFANVRHNVNEIQRISDALKEYNKSAAENQNKEVENQGNANIYRQGESADMISTAPVLQFNEGESIYAIYAVRSLGIDPVSGREVFLDRFGNTTMTWDARDQVVVGEAQPKYEGFFGTNTDIGNFSINLSFNYRLGGQIYNNTVIDRVENANLYNNVDQRVLEQRWTQEGDVKPYKSIADRSITRASSRFVEDEDMLSLASARVSYRFNPVALRNIGLRHLKLSMYMSDIFRISTVKRERGLTYPFARSVSFSLQTNF